MMMRKLTAAPCSGVFRVWAGGVYALQVSEPDGLWIVDAANTLVIPETSVVFACFSGGRKVIGMRPNDIAPSETAISHSPADAPASGMNCEIVGSDAGPHCRAPDATLISRESAAAGRR